jgi:hypothetical protein
MVCGMVFSSGQTLRFAIGVISLGLVEVCGAIASPVQAQAGPSAELPSAYWDAVEDAISHRQ